MKRSNSRLRSRLRSRSRSRSRSRMRRSRKYGGDSTVTTTLYTTNDSDGAAISQAAAVETARSLSDKISQ